MSSSRFLSRCRFLKFLLFSGFVVFHVGFVSLLMNCRFLLRLVFLLLWCCRFQSDCHFCYCYRFLEVAKYSRVWSVHLLKYLLMLFPFPHYMLTHSLLIVSHSQNVFKYTYHTLSILKFYANIQRNTLSSFNNTMYIYMHNRVRSIEQQYQNH